MKVLYAIQSTGNGHISRAKEIIPYLERRFQFDVMLSGPKTQLDLNYPIKHHFRGLTFYYNKSGAIHWRKTLIKNNFFYFIRDIFSLQVKDYDLVITDFEPISAWASKIRGVLCFGISNQVSLWQKNAPKPKKKIRTSLNYLKYFAPTNQEYGFHYHKFGRQIFSPIINSKLREIKVSPGGGIVVYLPSYHLINIIHCLKLFPKVKWYVFTKEATKKIKQGSITINPINENLFLKLMAKSDGVITNAGFTTTSEALYLGKPLLVIPMRGHIEQNSNAFALKKMGVTVIKKLSVNKIDQIADWLNNPKVVQCKFENDLKYLVDQITIDFIKNKLDNKIIFN
jgi:uncharacterized protein (TIGR00661 family)